MSKKYKIDVVWEYNGKPYYGAMEKRLFCWVRVPNLSSDPDPAVIEKWLRERLSLPTPFYYDAAGNRIAAKRKD